MEQSDSTEKRHADESPLQSPTPSPSSKSPKKKARRALELASELPQHGQEGTAILEKLLNRVEVLTEAVNKLQRIPDVLTELTAAVAAIRAEMEPLKKRLDTVESVLSNMDASLQSLGKRTDIIQAAQRQERATVTEVANNMAKIQSKLSEMEDRSRRSNLRIVGLPEGSEGDDPTGFLQRNLPVWLPALAGRVFEIERAHRVSSGRSTSTVQPRTLIFKLLRYTDRQHILAAYRKAGPPLSHGQAKLLIFPDYSNTTAASRRAFAPSIASLKQKGAETFLIYPAKLKVRLNAETHLFSSPEETQVFLQKLNF